MGGQDRAASADNASVGRLSFHEKGRNYSQKRSRAPIRTNSPLHRTRSGDSSNPKTPVATPISEVQLTKTFLEKEIEARSAKLLSVARRRLRGSLGSCDPNADEGSDGRLAQHKLFVVSWRLPFTVVYDEEAGTFETQHDPFGINFNDLFEGAFLVGTPMVRRKADRSIVMSLSEGVQEQLDEYLRVEQHSIPVFLPRSCDLYAERVIFPLFHYTLPSAETGLAQDDWEGYELVNRTFKDVVLRHYIRGDLVWINDYPLLLLPQLLREERPDVAMGFYLYCVFPSPEVFRILPQRKCLLRGVLSSNIIGFHSFSYVQNFLTSCIQVLGLECTTSGIEACEMAGGTHTKCLTMPRGIQVEPYHRILRCPQTMEKIERLQETFAGKRLVVAVDQLKERSGIQHKLMAYHRFLQKAPPELVAECVLVQLTSAETEALGDDELPSGESVEDQLLQQVYQMVGEVNSKFGRIGHLPVHFLCQEFSAEELASLFAKADVMIDTSLRDVIPHSAYNFLCCQVEDDCGVLILSEFSGSAPSLRAAALCVNPWDTNAFADAIQEALDMDKSDRLELYRYGYNHVHEYTLKDWATKFLEELQMAQQECENERLQIPPLLDHDKVVAAFATTSRRIIILGFGGALIPHKTQYFAKLFPKLANTLQINLGVLTDDPNTEVIVLSGLSREKLAGSLARVPCWIVAEGGVCYRKPDCDYWHSAVEQRDTAEWMEPVKEIMSYFADRTPGTSVVEMESSLCWLYQDTQGDHAAIQSKDLLIHLWAGPLLSAPAEVAVEKDCVSVKPSGCGKAQTLDKLLREIWGEPETNGSSPQDAFVLCLGDFLMRDEDVFVNCKNFFEPEPALSKAASPVEPKACQEDSLLNLEEEVNFEVNSRSLNSGYDFLSNQNREDFVGHLQNLGLHVQHSDNSSFCDDMALLRITSHPDIPAISATPEREQTVRTSLTASPSTEALHNVRSPSLFTCTVRRKATRAAYHLTDTHDVAFLVAKLAREVKQAKQSDFC
mmetsp:Transcript_99840/g.192821  ORF Transcript_99840/g.192821 Transcript_99840/m.192821 type:complete len:1008 (+) Transcript_99840:74-3097(+)